MGKVKRTKKNVQTIIAVPMRLEFEPYEASLERFEEEFYKGRFNVSPVSEEELFEARRIGQKRGWSHLRLCLEDYYYEDSYVPHYRLILKGKRDETDAELKSRQKKLDKAEKIERTQDMKRLEEIKKRNPDLLA